MRGESIIYFGKEWGEDPTSCNHVFEYLSRHNKVLWVNSIATRKPSLASAHDWRRIFGKLRKLLGGLTQVGPTAWLYQPAVVPLPYSKLAQKINRRLLRGSLRRQARKLGMQRPQLWTFLPNTAYMAGQLDESVLVYYCVDQWAHLSVEDSEKIAALERELLEKADVCFAASHLLAESKRRYNANTIVAPHGVDHKHFARALEAGTAVPPDIASLPRPVIGFFGGIHERIDLELLARIAAAHPKWALVLIGKVQVDLDRVRRLPNVHILGRRLYETLPAYCKGFDVGIMPYVDDEWIRHSNPIKLREYLSAGLPVVSTDVPEVRRFPEWACIGRTPEEFMARIEQALEEDTPARRRQRSACVQNETWEANVAQVCERVMQIKLAKTK